MVFNLYVFLKIIFFYQMASIENNLDVSFGIFGKGKSFSWATMKPAKILFYWWSKRKKKKSQAFLTRHSDTLPIY